MPYKHNQSRRHKIDKARYKVTNWPEYNKELHQRGDITIWFTEEALAAWHLTKTGARGRPQEYSALAIETTLFICHVVHQPLRQTEGFMNSLSRLMKSTISIPDYSSCCCPLIPLAVSIDHASGKIAVKRVQKRIEAEIAALDGVAFGNEQTARC